MSFDAKGVSMRLVVFCALIAFAFTLLRPLTYTPDSYYYLAAADSLKREGEFRNYESRDAYTQQMVGADGAPMTAWPPLLPLLLTVFSPSLINAVSYAVVVVLSAVLAGQVAGERWRILGAVGALLNPALPYVTGFVWSEPLFLALSTGGLVALIGYIQRPSRSKLVAVVIAFALAAITRYVGVALIGVVALSLLIWGSASLRQRLTRVLVTLSSAVPLLLWTARNVALAGMPFGIRPITSIDRMALSFSLLDALILLVGWALWVLVLAWVYRRWRRPQPRPRAIRITLFYLSVYVVLLLTVSSVTPFDPIGTRLLSPVFIPLLALTGWIGQAKS